MHSNQSDDSWLYVNKENLGTGKKDLPFPEYDFRLWRLFGYERRPDPEDKFGLLVSTQNELCHTTFDMKADTSTMLKLSFLFKSFGLTTYDILELIVDVKSLMVEFEKMYDVDK